MALYATDEGEKPVFELDPEVELNLLTELRPWGSVFAENLADTLLHRKPPHYYARYRKADFWNDVFVPTGVPWARMRLSVLLHVFVVVSICGLTQAWMLERQMHPQVRLHPVIHYNLSEYLPPMDTGAPPAPTPRKGQPLLAKQKVISLQPNADNHEQTIITPVDVKLPTNLPLPNIVAWTETPGVPIAAAVRETLTKLPNVPVDVIAPAPDFSRDVSKLKIADAAPKVVEAAPDVHGLQSTRKIDAQTNVVEPAPTADLAMMKRHTINAPAPAVVEAPPDANVTRKLGEMNIGKLAGTVAAPKLQVAEQRAVLQLQPGKAGGGGKPSAGSSAATGGAPPINPVGGMNTGVNSGQLISLNLHPAIPNGPIVVPPGRRSGEFAAGPEGTKDAPGTPEIKGGGTNVGGSGSAKAGAGTGNSKGLPAGITIGNAPGAPPSGSAVVAGDAANRTNSDKQVLVADARPPRVGEVPRETVRGGAPDAPKIEERVFSGKQVYTLSMNMPNLTSSGGSWIIRFAQLDNDKTAGLVGAPVAMSKVDPAYPAALIKDGVEGTVILYAVIHKDGTVGEVRVLRGVQGRLDESARVALARWKFRPGTKNGEAVDLEAVVQIPFKAPRW